MSRPIAVLRPEPGNAATATRAEALGLAVIRLPLFELCALDWAPPDAAAHDALILTSANAVRHGGSGLAALRSLPVLAVGERTAVAARDAGLRVIATGTGDAAALLALTQAHGTRRALHLCGRDRIAIPGQSVSATIAVYASDALPVAPADAAALADSVALLHSARAARRLGEIATDRARIRIAALSDAVLVAAGDGWADVAAAPEPADQSLLAIARRLAD